MATSLNTDNTYVSYDYTQTVTSPDEKREVDVQFFLQADSLAGYRYSEVVLGTIKPTTHEVKFSNEYVPISKEQREELAHRLLQAGVFDLKSDEVDDAKKEFSSMDVRIGEQDKRFWFNTKPESALRKKIHNIMLDFAKEIKIDQPASREKATQNSEGDAVPAKQVSFADVLASPTKFNGKRISVIGFYHDEFEGRNLATDETASEKRDYRKSIWRGEPSSFADRNKIHFKNDSWLQIEGIFVQGPEGHMGMWPGAINRITRVDQVAAPK